MNESRTFKIFFRFQRCRFRKTSGSTIAPDQLKGGAEAGFKGQGAFATKLPPEGAKSTFAPLINIRGKYAKTSHFS